jgi:hypothetical protein
MITSVLKKPLVNKVLIVILHLCGWALLFMMPFRFLARNRPMPPDGGRMMPDVPFDPTWFRIESLITNSLLAIFFYTNMFLFVPRILSKKGWLSYLFVVLALLGVYLTIGYFLRINFAHFAASGRHGFGPPFFIGVPNFFMVLGLSLSLRLMQDRSSYENALKEQENEKLKSELSFLRSQVSPHFMFNILNSLAALARKKSDKVESAIIQLSQLMRYTLYHTDKKVSVEQEAEYLTNYIELQRLRFGTQVHIHFHQNLEKKDILIEPMLLVPFVENAFKHGVGLIKDPVIMIILEATAYQVTFTVRNKFNSFDKEVKDSSSGIGLQNVRRRLDLLYKDLYSLETYTNEEQWFIVELKLIPE